MIRRENRALRLFTALTLATVFMNLLGVVVGWGYRAEIAGVTEVGNAAWAVPQWVFPNGIAFLVYGILKNAAWAACALAAVAIPTVLLLRRAQRWEARRQVILMVALGLAGPVLTLVGQASIALAVFDHWGRFYSS